MLRCLSPGSRSPGEVGFAPANFAFAAEAGSEWGAPEVFGSIRTMLLLWAAGVDFGDDLRGRLSELAARFGGPFHDLTEFLGLIAM